MNNMKKIGLLFILVGIITVGTWLSLSRDQAPTPSSDESNKTLLEMADESNVKTFSLKGTVYKLEPNRIYFNTGYVQKTEQGNQFVEKEIQVLFNHTTVFYKGNFKAIGTSSELKTGNVITVYTNENPLDLQELVAQSILIHE
jgi:hypothetical protein